MKKILMGFIIFLGAIFCCTPTNSHDSYSIKVDLSNQNVQIFRNGVLPLETTVEVIDNRV